MRSDSIRLTSTRLKNSDGEKFTVNVYDQSSIDVIVDTMSRYNAYNLVSKNNIPFEISAKMRKELTRVTL
jgi:hypothetical protein